MEVYIHDKRESADIEKKMGVHSFAKKVQIEISRNGGNYVHLLTILVKGPLVLSYLSNAIENFHKDRTLAEELALSLKELQNVMPNSKLNDEHKKNVDSIGSGSITGVRFTVM